MQVYLIGTGVVGREILKAHLDADIPICVADQNEVQLNDSIERLGNERAEVRPAKLGRLPAVEINGSDDCPAGPKIVIESISERLDVKQSFFQTIEQLLDEHAVLCTNTSTLRIGHIASKLKHPNRLCGMHFFMPVDQRDAVEVVRGKHTDSDAVEACLHHIRSLQKTPIVVADTPGFIVNRLLCPYLNQALLLLGQGVCSEDLPAATIEICERYRRGQASDLSDEDVMLLLATPMWIEAAMAFREGVAEPIDQVNIAMSGGLGYRSTGTWLQFFASIGSERLLDLIERFAATTKALHLPGELLAELKVGNPTQAIHAFAGR